MKPHANSTQWTSESSAHHSLYWVYDGPSSQLSDKSLYGNPRSVLIHAGVLRNTSFLRHHSKESQLAHSSCHPRQGRLKSQMSIGSRLWKHDMKGEVFMCVFVCLFGLDSLWSKRPYRLMEELEVITESLKKKREGRKKKSPISHGVNSLPAEETASNVHWKKCVKMALDEAAKSQTKKNTWGKKQERPIYALAKVCPLRAVTRTKLWGTCNKK